MAKAYLVVRIKGQADVPYWANTTFIDLALAVLSKTTPSALMEWMIM